MPHQQQHGHHDLHGHHHKQHGDHHHDQHGDHHEQQHEPRLTARPSNYSSNLGYSLYLKIIILTVVFGTFTCGLGTYWEIILITAHAPHLSYQLIFIISIIIGSFAAAFALPMWGRRRPLIYSVLPLYPAYVLNALYQYEHWCDLLSRVLAGFAIGAYLTTACVYMGEISLARCRGRNYALMIFAFWLGMAVYMLLYRINPYCSLVMLVMLIIYMVLAWIYLPETPYYVMQINEKEFAAEVLHFLRCGQLMYKEMEYLSIARFVFGSDHCAFWSFERRWQILDRAWTACLLMLYVHMTGFPIFIINFKLVRAAVPESVRGNLAKVDWLQLRAYDLICFMTIVFLSIIAFLIYYCTIDRCRHRQWLMAISLLGTNICLIVMCAYYYLRSNESSGLAYILYVCTPAYFFSYFLGQAYFPFLFIGEIFPHNLKHAFCAFGISGYFIFTSFEYFLVRVMIMSFGPLLTCVYFTVMNLLGVAFVMLLIPAYTKYSLEAIQEYFDGHHRGIIFMDSVPSEHKPH